MSRRRLTQPQAFLPSPPLLTPPFFLFSFFLLLPPFHLVLLCLETECCSTAQTFSPNLSSPSQTWWASLRRGAWPALEQNNQVCLASTVGTMALGLLSQTLLWFLAPRRDRTRPLVPKASTKLFVDRPDFFDYPDSDRASLHAVARFIGEKPVIFIKTGMSQIDRGAPYWQGLEGIYG